MNNEDELYSQIPRLRKNKAVLATQDDGPGLSELVHRNWGVLSQYDIIKALCYELKMLLDSQDVGSLVKGIFTVEGHLSLLDEIYEGNDSPDLDRFFRNLSPVLLRALYQNSTHPVNTDLIIHDWIEALRIAVEEEYYFWQEQLLEV
ncbi:MAG: hypothetical protein KAG61_00555 [Bacteriovoracaceae bacterium]|nr:hypothetical protein [Bacteriovoracaceae bacterium]